LVLLLAVGFFLEKFLMWHPIGNRPILFLGIVLMVLGVQVVGVGLLGGIITFIHRRQREEYTLEKKI